MPGCCIKKGIMMERLEYEECKIELIIFNAEDVIVTSSKEDFDGDWQI